MRYGSYRRVADNEMASEISIEGSSNINIVEGSPDFEEIEAKGFKKKYFKEKDSKNWWGALGKVFSFS